MKPLISISIVLCLFFNVTSFYAQTLSEPNDNIVQANVVYPDFAGSLYSNSLQSNFANISDPADFIKINTLRKGSLIISLTALPDDYDLYLYSKTGTLINSSENGGTASESINLTVTDTGTYYIAVKVYSWSTAANYTLDLLHNSFCNTIIVNSTVNST